LDTITPVAPASAARTASSGRITPLTTIGPSHSSRIQSRSAQDTVPSNMSEILCSERWSGGPMLGKLIVGEVTKCQAQSGCSAPSSSVVSGRFGTGSSRPACCSRSRLDRTTVSMDSSSALNPAAFARETASLISPRSPHTYSWNHSGVPVCAATSSSAVVASVDSP
jgi:hypothetical protein